MQWLQMITTVRIYGRSSGSDCSLNEWRSLSEKEINGRALVVIQANIVIHCRDVHSYQPGNCCRVKKICERRELSKRNCIHGTAVESNRFVNEENCRKGTASIDMSCSTTPVTAALNCSSSRSLELMRPRIWQHSLVVSILEVDETDNIVIEQTVAETAVRLRNHSEILYRCTMTTTVLVHNCSSLFHDSRSKWRSSSRTTADDAVFELFMGHKYIKCIIGQADGMLVHQN